MKNINALLEARHHLGLARLELMLVSEKLTQTGFFSDTIKEIDDTVNDLTKAVEQVSKHIKD